MADGVHLAARAPALLADGLHGDDPRAAAGELHGRGDPRGQAAAPAAHHHDADVGAVLEHLQAARRVTADEVEVVKGVNQQAALALDARGCCIQQLGGGTISTRAPMDSSSYRRSFGTVSGRRVFVGMPRLPPR